MTRIWRKTVLIALLAMVHSVSFTVLNVYPRSADLPASVAEGQNPDSRIQLDEDGTPLGAKGKFYPAETNPILGRTPVLTPLECITRYGENFCRCGTLEDGTQYCYYNRPAAGFYSSMEACESVWGAGHCICPSEDQCRLYDPQDEGRTLQCLGQVYFFSGEKYECRKSGIMTVGKDCCGSKSQSSDACSFENVAKELGMDDLALAVVSLGTKLADVAGYSVTDMLANQIGQVVVETWLKEGSVGTIGGSLTGLLGDEGAQAALDALADQMLQGGLSITDLAAQEAIAQVAGAITNFVTAAGWVYFAYQCYQMVQQLQQCSAGEYILECKKAKGVCRKVGNRCKVKIFGVCLQSMAVYCCFSTKLARIINEQGRPQIGKGWGSAKKPRCEGFMMDEFARLDLSRIDFTEFADDLVREMSPGIAGKLEDALKNLNQTLSRQD